MANSSHRAAGEAQLLQVPVQRTVMEMLSKWQMGGWMGMSGPGSTSRNGTRRPKKSVK